jgi:hypothetical protein
MHTYTQIETNGTKSNETKQMRLDNNNIEKFKSDNYATRKNILGLDKIMETLQTLYTCLY